MSASRAIQLPTGMAMTFAIGRPVAATDVAAPDVPATDPAWERDDAEPQPAPRAARVIGIRDGRRLADGG